VSLCACEHSDEISDLREQVRLKDLQIDTYSKMNQDLEREVR